MKHIRSIVGASLLAIGLTACFRTVNSVEVGSSVDGQYRWIQTDSGMSQIAAVVSAKKVRVNDLLKVQVEVKNLRPIQERFYSKFEWLDNDGMLVDTPLSTWEPRIIPGNEVIMIQGIAPHPGVTDCRLKLQESSR